MRLRCLLVLTVLTLSACGSDYSEPGAREAAGGYDLYNMLGRSPDAIERVMGEPLSEGDPYDYSERGHRAFDVAYPGGVRATYLVQPTGKGCLAVLEFVGAGARRPNMDDPALYGFPAGSLGPRRSGHPDFWQRDARLASGRPAFMQEATQGRPRTGSLRYGISSAALYEACGLSGNALD